MLGDKIFRIAILVSIGAHSAFLMPWSDFGNFSKTSKNQKPLEVNYLEIKIEPIAKALEEKTDKPLLQIPTKGKISKERQISQPKSEPAIIARKTDPVKTEPKKALQTAEKKRDGVYVGYYNMIREKIRLTLSKIYKPRFGEGEVYLEFTLRSNGTLVDLHILDDSTPSRNLKSAAHRALKRAAPFPSFPEELTEPQINFNVAISFCK